ncbi:MAG: response regulator [Chloroflexota bacterium]
MTQKILIVDDEDYIRLLIEQTLEELEDEGVELLTADNGADGLALIKAESPNLVFLDVMMPQMNGYEVCRTVKRELQLDDVFIVMLTAKGQEFDKDRGMSVGADVYMTKPFDPDDLLEKAAEVLEIDI